MNVNSYLVSLARSAIVRDSEKESIQRSISMFQTRLDGYFRSDLKDDFVFGSFSRGTILPRSMDSDSDSDSDSDIDYMVVFNDSDSRPQTYLNRLRRFVEAYYSRSEIAQSNPTILLSLNHIRFELVPAIDDWWGGLQIPDKASSFNDWIETDPTEFNGKLVSENMNNSNLIKPLVRLVKYWNSRNGHIFDSYGLEKDIVNHGFWFYGLLRTTDLKSYFYDYMEELDVGLGASSNARAKVDRLNDIIRAAKGAEQNGQEEQAVKLIQKLLPPVNQLTAAPF